MPAARHRSLGRALGGDRGACRVIPVTVRSLSPEPLTFFAPTRRLTEHTRTSLTARNDKAARGHWDSGAPLSHGANRQPQVSNDRRWKADSPGYARDNGHKATIEIPMETR